ncbi:MAG: hypothetical protein ABIS21_03515 [Acidimicrobiales bacterium]
MQAGEFEALVGELRSFARQRPAAFLLGAAVAGFGVGRIVRVSGADDEPEVQLADSRVVGAGRSGGSGRRAPATIGAGMPSSGSGRSGQ